MRSHRPHTGYGHLVVALAHRSLERGILNFLLSYSGNYLEKGAANHETLRLLASFVQHLLLDLAYSNLHLLLSFPMAE